MSSMFNGCSVFDQNIREWLTTNVTTFSNMFTGATDMITTYTGVTGFGTTPTNDFFNQVPTGGGGGDGGGGGGGGGSTEFRITAGTDSNGDTLYLNSEYDDANIGTTTVSFMGLTFNHSSSGGTIYYNMTDHGSVFSGTGPDDIYETIKFSSQSGTNTIAVTISTGTSGFSSENSENANLGNNTIVANGGTIGDAYIAGVLRTLTVEYV